MLIPRYVRNKVKRHNCEGSLKYLSAERKLCALLKSLRKKIPPIALLLEGAVKRMAIKIQRENCDMVPVSHYQDHYLPSLRGN